MINHVQINLLIREGEGLTVEFKERFTPRIDEDMGALLPIPRAALFFWACVTTERWYGTAHQQPQGPIALRLLVE
ncbi:MAG: hypothetical protein A2511_11460 [Deltaproteobacteria bacterium RIFOXYD12_FULL_50_9]|nr:MAG: hypothetical protein A2511_11460 [Deltaproteobacteria bacterium RIFOXYD12_FULL_50_9]